MEFFVLAGAVSLEHYCHAAAPLPTRWCCSVTIESPLPGTQIAMPPLHSRSLPVLTWVGRHPTTLGDAAVLEDRAMPFVELSGATVLLRARVDAVRCDGGATTEALTPPHNYCRRALRAAQLFVRISGSASDHAVDVAADATAAALFDPPIAVNVPAGTRALALIARGLSNHAALWQLAEADEPLARTSFETFPRSAARPLPALAGLHDGWWVPHAARLSRSRDDDARLATSSPRVVLHIGDLTTVDGYKMSIVAQARHLVADTNANEVLRFEYLDLSCAPASDPRKGALRRILSDVNIHVHELCVRAPPTPGLDSMEGFKAGLRTLTDPRVASLNDARVPGFAAAALRPVAELLIERGVTTIVVTNGAERGDEWLLELARICGVQQRVVDLGSKGPLAPFPVTPAVTHYVAPSHFVAQHVNVRVATEHASAGTQLLVLHPFIHLNGATGGDQLDAADDDAGSRPCGRERAASSDTVVIAFVGRLVSQKGASIFVRAAALVQQWRRSAALGKEATLPPICWVVVGEGELGAFLQRRAREQNAAVHFTGFVPHDEMRRVLLVAPRVDVLVFPSLYPEALGMSAVEALGLGIPVITSGIGGATECVRHDENGIVVPLSLPRCPEGLRRLADAAAADGRPLGAERFACAAAALALNATLRRTLGQNGRALVEAHFSVEAQAARWRHLFDVRPPRRFDK